jgi:predicted amidophosphoribosyltransferase
VDDVMTSGATLTACAQAARVAGASDVRVLVVARALLDA